MNNIFVTSCSSQPKKKHANDAGYDIESHITSVSTKDRELIQHIYVRLLVNNSLLETKNFSDTNLDNNSNKDYMPKVYLDGEEIVSWSNKEEEENKLLELHDRDDWIIIPPIHCSNPNFTKFISSSDTCRLIPTKVQLNLEDSDELTCALILPRSSISTQRDLIIPNSPGLIDAGYQDFIKVAFTNIGRDFHIISNKQRIAQLLFINCYNLGRIIATKNYASISSRNTGGFGSTGNI
jgi:deoxyuridine 5'-triphosphate nucleotidohydrolase